MPFKLLSRTKRTSQKGYTLVELLVVIVILGILASLVIQQYKGGQEKTYYGASVYGMKNLLKAVEYYNFYYGDYPAEVSHNLPSGLGQFVVNSSNSNWPSAPWPNSQYDYDRFTYDGVDTVQISIRFCPVGGTLSQCAFPPENWAANFGVNSSIYACLKGNCKAHPNMPTDYPGYCVMGCSADRSGGSYYQPAGYSL